MNMKTNINTAMFLNGCADRNKSQVFMPYAANLKLQLIECSIYVHTVHRFIC